MVRIADRIWPAWRERTERGDEPAIVLLLMPAGDDGAAVAALREAVLEVQGAAGPFPGEWDWLRTGDGILVQVVECEALEEVLPAVAAALGQRGVEGAFELPEPPEAATPPRTAHMLECRLRVRGHRVRRAPRSYLWQPEREAYEAVLAAADGWVRRVKHGARSLTSSTVGPVPVAPDEDVVGRLLEAVGDRMHVSVSAVGAGEFRSIAARAWSGGVSLVAGGAWIEGGRWQPALAELTDVLRDQAALIVYGCVRRGWAVSQALLDDALPPDWPPRAGREPDGIGFTSEAFEDVYAPDTFGIQLLGAGYAGRLPDAAAWRCERVADATVVLKHRDPVAWFDAPFVPLRERARGDAGPPPVLATARRELAPLLYQPGVLSRDDLAEEPGL